MVAGNGDDATSFFPGIHNSIHKHFPLLWHRRQKHR
jgi:hypothetical protein